MFPLIQKLFGKCLKNCTNMEIYLIIIKGFDMGISYAKMRNVISEARIRHQDIHDNAHVSNDVLAKLEKDEYMNLESFERIAKYLSKATKKRLQFSDLIDFK